MFYEEGHPDVTLKDWQGFKSWQKSCKILPLHHIDEVIDRDESGCIPHWFAPLARGVVIASDTLLREAGYHSGSGRPSFWTRTSHNVFKWDLNHCGRFVQGFGDLWIVGEWGVVTLDKTLVHVFGSTPILTRNYQSAIHLATYNWKNGFPGSLRFIKTSPTNVDAAIEFARKRRSNEALSANSALATGR
jgi:hypothetical protein